MSTVACGVLAGAVIGVLIVLFGEFTAWIAIADGAVDYVRTHG